MNQAAVDNPIVRSRDKIAGSFHFSNDQGETSVGTQIDSAVRTVENRPAKTCSVCGGTIVWKRWLDRNWHELKYCGAVCRRKAVAREKIEVNESISSSPAA